MVRVQYITVKSESDGKIASNHVNAGEDVRELIFAIKQVNELGNNAEIFPGQELKIPVSKPAPTKIASIF